MTKYYQDVDCRLEEKRADEGGGDRGESAGAEANTAEEAMPKLNRGEAADGGRGLQKDTAGDGSGTGLAYLILPESGLVVQYSSMYGVTADGTASGEYGTVPDIVSPKGESALETCLKQTD